MYKGLLVVAVLVAAFGVAGHSSSARPAPTTVGLPLVVAQGAMLNQSGPIPTTTVYTPALDGMFRLSVYATMTNSSGNGQQWLVNVGWTDDVRQFTESGALFGNDNESIPFMTLGAGAPQGAVIPFKAKAGTPVTYSVDGGPDGSQYSIYYALERLQ
jgi:hypothetical protein